MTESQCRRRRTLIRLIVFVAVIQVGILAYLWALLRPSEPQETVAAPTPTQYQLPTRPPRTDAQPTRTPAPGSEGIAIASPVGASNYARRAVMFDEELALEHIAYLASDELAGRQPGTPGGQAASEYIAAAFSEYGLKPAGADGTYFQTFSVPYGRITELPLLTVIPPGGETLTRTYTYRTDYRALTGGYIGAGAGEGPVVWLSECLHDDYAGLDMVGKVALCRYSHDPQIYRQAIEHQVGGLLLLDREGQISISRRPGYRETSWVPQTIPTYLISETVASDLLVGTGYTLDDLSLRFTPMPLSATVRLAVAIEEEEAVEARNVLGLLPGSDPQYDDEIVLLGAHYDHLGRDPDGEVMHGANDNASGVATMLEIARLWQAQGYHPARSVLFAAWDGEEQGLLGSQHYTQYPTNSLTRTIAALNLDMVGTGEALQIDGGGIVATQLQASAETYDITTTLTFDGRSDHVSFYEAGIPAANLIWWPDVYYHTPGDTVQVIEPDKLKSVGVLSSHALAALAEGHVELKQAVEQLRASILAGNREAFLAGIDPQDPALRASQAAWFDNLWSRELVQAAIQPSQVRIGDGEARVTLIVSYSWAAASRPTRSISYDVRFVERDGIWYFAGYELDRLAGDAITVARFPDVPVGMGQLLSTTQEAYVALAADLAFEPHLGARFIYYPDAPTMRTIARPATDQATRWLVSSGSLAEIAWGHPITPALVHLLLNQMGLPPGAGNWLREGLTSHYEGSGDRDYLPALASADVLTPLLDFPDLDGLPVSQARTLRSTAWSATRYLLDRYGTQGLRALCSAWGQSDDPEVVFREALGLTASQFESAWRAERVKPLRADAAAIGAVVAARVEAVLAGDAAAFLDTVNPDDPVLQAEERIWFADLAEHPAAAYAAASQITGWSPNAAEASVALGVEATTVDGQRRQVTYDARFARTGGRWHYAGADWHQLSSEHFVLKYRRHDAAWASRILTMTGQAYAQVTADLGAAPLVASSPQEIKVYDDGDVFRALISLSAPDWVGSCVEPGTAIRLLFEDGSQRDLQRAIVHELTDQVLSAQGLDSDWLREGVADFEAGQAIPLGTHWMAGQYLPIVQEAVRRHDQFPLYEMPSWEDVPHEQDELFSAQSWSLVSFIAERHGLPGLRRFIAQFVSSDDTAANLRAAVGVDPASFQQEWEDHIWAASVPADLIGLAQAFDPERALAHIAVLSSPEFGGREAGAPGADLAAAYIAEQFATLGLEPLGDLPLPLPTSITATLTGTGTTTLTTGLAAGMTGTATMAGTLAPAQRSYLQQFPVSHTHLISVPTFALLDAQGTPVFELVYNEDFVERTGEGVADGELVWLRPGSLEGLYFGGAVVLQHGVQSNAAYAASLQAHGASGLIVANGRDFDSLQMEHLRGTSQTEATIPVFELTESAFEALLGELGTDYRKLIAFQSPALPLDVRARQTLAHLPVTTTHTANVLGLLPGSDPALADEVLLIGAHYDHIGQSPDGLYFPGANQNASGVGVMLEMIRAWQSAGYRPARSVMFAAWGAQEMDGAGAAYYLADPAVPLTRTLGVIALDTVGGGAGYKLLFYGTREHDTPLIHRVEAAATALDRRAWRRGSAGEGWHVGFNRAAIPTTKLIWDDAESGFYSLTDTPDAIDLDRLATSGEVLTLTTAWLARR